MKFHETSLAGAFLIEPTPINDNRGFFARAYSEDEFQKRGLHHQFVQANISFNRQINVIRGMHYQLAPYSEVKLVRCTLGEIYDVIVDIRPQSPTYKQWFGTKLSQDNRHILYIPDGFAHGFQTLTDESEVFYMMGEYYYPEAARGFRWNDSNIAINWQNLEQELILSAKDASLPEYFSE